SRLRKKRATGRNGSSNGRGKGGRAGRDKCGRRLDDARLSFTSGALLDQRYGLLAQRRVRVHRLGNAVVLIRRPPVLGDRVEGVLLRLDLCRLRLLLR